MTSQPYTPSWIDRFWEWVDRLPFPAWLFYIGFYALGALFIHAALWIDGEAAVGSIDGAWVSRAVWVALPLSWMHYLERLAARALPQFDPVVPDTRTNEYESIRFRMVTMPARTTLLLTLIPMLVVAGGIVSDPEFTYGTSHQVAAYPFLIVAMALAFGMLPVLIYFNVRMLRLVTAAYRLVDDPPLIDQRPLFSLANLTMQIGLSWVIVVNWNLASTFLLEGGTITDVDRVILFAFSGFGIVLAFVLFLLPLRGIHRRLSGAKEGLITENALALDRTRVKLYEALADDDHEEVERFDRGISSLLRIRDELQTIPTWPWRHGTLRGFSSAVITPMLLWGAQQALTRWF